MFRYWKTHTFGSRFYNYLAFAWGFAEATFFFIVPDVLTSRIAMGNLRAAWKACVYALAGALLGGSILFFFGKESPGFVYNLNIIPGIDAALIQKARLGMEESGLNALFWGVLSGIPYKLYASQAYFSTYSSYLDFLIYSVIARGLRFFGVTTLAGLLALCLPKSWSLRQKQKVHLWFWIFFYVFYFWKMGF